jgi:hypothetical protein
MRSECHALIREALRTSRSARLLLEAATRATEEEISKSSERSRVVVLAKPQQKSSKHKKGKGPRPSDAGDGGRN